MKKEKVLIGTGCSHTQGSAFLKNKTFKGDQLELATDEVKNKYNREYVTEEWITENITWMGKLNNHLKYDKILNFGLGGRGFEANIRSLRSYTYKVQDLSNHLIIIALPEFTRKEFLVNTGEEIIDFFHGEYNHTYYRLNMASSAVNYKSGKTFIKTYYHPEFNEYILLNELYYLQDYLELKGAKVFSFPFKCGWKNMDDIKYKYKNLVEHSENWYNFFTPTHSFHTELQTPPEPEEIIEKINWLFVGNWGGLGVEETTLHGAGLVKDDMHLSELGNEFLAETIYEALNEKMVI